MLGVPRAVMADSRPSDPPTLPPFSPLASEDRFVPGLPSPSRHRDILPMPFTARHNFEHKQGSQSIRKRLSRKNRVIDWADEGIQVLNSLGAAPKVSASTTFSSSFFVAAQ